MGLAEFAGKRREGQIKMRVGKRVKKVNTKIKPGLGWIKPGTKCSWDFKLWKGSVASHHNRGSCGDDLEGINSTFWGAEREGEAKPWLPTEPEGRESYEPMHGCGPCPGAGLRQAKSCSPRRGREEKTSADILGGHEEEK